MEELSNNQIYEGLITLTQIYIREPKRAELLEMLLSSETESNYPPGKGILACVDSHSNGVSLKQEHEKLWQDICHYCV